MRKFEYAKDNPYGDFGLPRRSTKNAAGYDFIAPYDFTVKPNETVLVKTFVKCKMPPDFYLKIYARSSQGIFMKYYRTEDDDADGTRVGAFGSTGK
jgi:dUTPase|nr:MAG TPA: dUTPase [Caudoviricetes sp.]